MNAEAVIGLLGLEPHPEGGYFREMYRSGRRTSFPGYQTAKALCTSIFFLLGRNDFSAFHRIRQDEIWHHYAGSALLLHVFETGSRGYRCLRLGKNLSKGETPLAVVPGRSVQAAESTGKWTLAGCTVAPGFDFSDFKLVDRAGLLAEFPGCAGLIRRLSR